METKKPVVTKPVKKTEVQKETKVTGKPEMKKTKAKNGGVLSFWREIILGVINIALIVTTLYYVTKLPERAKTAKEQRNSTGAAIKLNTDLAKFEIESSKEKVDKLKSLFPDQKELIDFIANIDRLKAEANVVNFAFASEAAVKEKSGNVGYPFVIEFEGTMTQVTDGLEKFSRLPYLFKPVNISIEKSDEGNLILLRYGGFLYIDDGTTKN